MGESAVYEKVIRENPNLLEMHQFGQKSVNSTNFVNPFVPRNVEKSQSEEVISCYALEQGSKNVALYFISRDYTAKGPLDNSTGRFVFRRVDPKGDLTAIAFVEEPPNARIRRPRNDNWQPQLEMDFDRLDSSTCLYKFDFRIIFPRN